MKRCNPLALALCCTLLAAAPAHAQTPLTQRTFPEAAQRGTLTLVSAAAAEIDGKPVRLAPGLRIFNPRNALVFAHTLVGRRMKVNYVIEASTGRLHTVWLLTEAEARQPRKKGGAAATNIRTES